MFEKIPQESIGGIGKSKQFENKILLIFIWKIFLNKYSQAFNMMIGY